MKSNIAIAIRGHERGTMSDNEFSDVIFELSKIHNCDLFLHTWSLSEADSSWRNLPKDRLPITEEKIKNYFYRNDIKKIFVENDEDIELFGRIFGRLAILTETTIPYKILEELLHYELGDWAKNMDVKAISQNKDGIFCFLQYGCPILPWKKMWHGIYTLVNFINNYKKYDLILNIRFDILRYKRFFNPGSPLINLDVIKGLIDKSTPDKLFTFLEDNKASCIDNIYTAQPIPLLILCERFHFDLDNLVASYEPKDWSGIQEHLVYLESQKIKKMLLNNNV